MALQIGDIVGDYEIVGVLGKGGMGTVFRVRNLLSDRIEAMKVALPDLNANPMQADRFLREIRLHASLEHPHIAALRTALRIDNQVLMVMELVEGGSLDQRLRLGPLDALRSVRYTDQILSALDLAHSRGIIHRDIKPANIIVTPEDTIKLTDFGIARSDSERNLTITGMALGSLFYMSPEQVQAMPSDPRSDIYSLGLTAYEMVTGKRAIEGESEYAILSAHLSQTPPSPTSVNPAVPPTLSAAIMKAIAKHPGDRFQNAAEFRDALRSMETLSNLPPVTERMPVASSTGFNVSTDPVRAQIESALLKTVGPIAKIMVSRVAAQCSSISELRDRLAAQISDPTDRTKFLRSLSTTQSAAAPTTTVNPAAENTHWDPAVLANAKQHLAHYAGPIASVIVDRTARKARTAQELYQMLSLEIASDRDRAAFLKRAPK